MSERIHHFFATDMRVISAEVNRGSEDAHDPQWEISYAQPEDGDDFRFVAGWLHGAGAGIQVAVTIGAIVVETGMQDEEYDFEELIQKSEALSTLYQRARDAATLMVALTDGEIKFPKFQPEPKIESLPGFDDAALEPSEEEQHQ